MFNKTKPSTPIAKPQPALTPPMTATPAPSLAPNPIAATPAQAAAPRPKPVGAKPLSSINSGILIDGNVTGNGDLHLDGTVRGDVKVAHLIVGESGNIEGKIEAETVEVRGRVVGSIQGRQVKLQATAYVEGDILHDQLSIDVGAFFQGRCQQNRRVDAPVAAPVTTQTVAPVAPAHVTTAPEAVAPVAIAPVSTPVAPTETPAAPVITPVVATPSLDAYDVNALSDLK